MLALPRTSGFATRKFDGSPAAIALARRAALLIRLYAKLGVVAFVLQHGCGLNVASELMKVESVNDVDVYFAGSAACPEATPLKYARMIGSGDVPGAPVYANVLPRPAAMFACRLACAFRNSFRKPFSTMLISLMLFCTQSSTWRLPT